MCIQLHASEPEQWHDQKVVAAKITIITIKSFNFSSQNKTELMQFDQQETESKGLDHEDNNIHTHTNTYIGIE